MAVNANTSKTYDSKTIREDLQEALVSISPTDTPFITSIAGKSRTVENTLFEWPVAILQAPDSGNRVLEGESNPDNDAPTVAARMQNYTQISDKVAEVSSTANAVKGAGGNLQSMAKQISLKLKEMKRDMEVMLLSGEAANPGGAGTVRATAGLKAFLRSNVSLGENGEVGDLSGGTFGYPSTSPVDGDLRALTEDMVNDVIEQAWTEGGNPSVLLCGGKIKRKITKSFTGTADRQRDANEKKAGASVDLYVSDFGDLTITPSRLMSQRDVFIIDPDYVRLAWLQETKQELLAKTGHSERRLISAEYGLQVDTELAHGRIGDINADL